MTGGLVVQNKHDVNIIFIIIVVLLNYYYYSV